MEGVDGMTGIHGARLGQTMIALMGVVAVIASLPETPKLDPLRVGKIVGALVRGRADEAEMRKSVSIAAARNHHSGPTSRRRAFSARGHAAAGVKRSWPNAVW